MIQRLHDPEVERVRDLVRGLEPPYLIFKFDASADDYYTLADEDFRCEYIDGVIVMHSPASVPHERIVLFLGTLVNAFVTKHGLGEAFASNVIMKIGENRFWPDMTFLVSDQEERIGEQEVSGAMDLAVEVLSRSTRRYDLEQKRPAYHAAGVRGIWLIDPDRREFHVDFAMRHGYESATLVTGRLVSRVIPGLVLDIDWLWSKPLPAPLACLDGMTDAP